MSEWAWVPVSDELLDGLPGEARSAVEQLAAEITVRDSLLYPEGRSYTGLGPGIQIEHRGRLVLGYISDIRSELVVIVQVTWLG